MDKPLFASPESLDRLLHLYEDQSWLLVAGGTDVIPRMHAGNLSRSRLLDISHVGELNFIDQVNGQIRIGALATYAEISNAPLLHENAPSLVQAARKVGAEQTRQRGTIGGSIGNASPAGDILAALLTYNATVTIVSAQGNRSVLLEKLFIGPGKTALEAGEIVHYVSFEIPGSQTRSAFSKLGNRRGMTCAVVNSAVLLEFAGESTVNTARIALGAVAPKPIRCPQAEVLLIGQTLTLDLIDQVAAVAADECHPIDDVRASASYRRHVARLLTQRNLLITSELG